MKAPRVLLLFFLLPFLWAGELALDLRNTPLKNVIAYLSQETKEEIIQGSDLTTGVNGYIRCSNLEEALKAISLLYPRLNWAKLSFPVKEKVSKEDIILTARALQAVKLSKVAASGKEGDIFFTKTGRAGIGEKDIKTVYVVWEEAPNLLNLLSTPQAKLTPQDYINLNWMMLNAFLSMSPEEKKQVLLASFDMVLRDPALLQRMMQESLSLVSTLSPEEMGKLVGASIQAVQSIPPEFWQQMMQSMGQFMGGMGAGFPGMMPQMGGGGE